jgi:hypothetical protein
MRKVLYAILALLGFAVWVRADTLTFPAGELIVPNQATAISVTVQPPGPTATEFYIANFVFPDGTGLERGDFNDGDNGFINFTIPVVNLTIDFVLNPSGYVVSANSQIVSECNDNAPGACVPTKLVLSLAGPVSSIEWENFPGFSGIESMSYTLAVPTPEPGALWLLLTGLLLGLSRWAQMSLRRLSGHCK